MYREPGDQSGKHLRRAAAIDERTERSAAGKEEEHPPHQVLLHVLPRDDGLFLLVTQEEHEQAADQKHEAGFEPRELPLIQLPRERQQRRCRKHD